MATNIQSFLSKLDDEERLFVQTLINDLTTEQQDQFVKLYQKRRKSPSLILFTALLGFMGIAGIDRFLVGQKVLGIVYLLTLGFYFIGTIFDCLTYKKIARKYNKAQADLVASKKKEENQQIRYYEAAQERKQIFDTYDSIVNELLNEFQSQVWPSTSCDENRTLHYPNETQISKAQQYAWKGWYIGKLVDGALRYFYGIGILTENEIGNSSPLFAVCYAENQAPKTKIVKPLKSELSEALGFAATQKPIDIEGIKNTVDDQLRMAILIDLLAIGQVKVEYLGYLTKELERQMR
jgi:TM2 domain-containing membrane protein YozV